MTKTLILLPIVYQIVIVAVLPKAGSKNPRNEETWHARVFAKLLHHVQRQDAIGSFSDSSLW